MLSLRPSTDADVPAITAIYAHHVTHGTGTFETTPPTEADMAARRADVLSKGLPYLVAEQDAAIAASAMSISLAAHGATWLVVVDAGKPTWWNGSAEVPATLTWWNGTAEVPLTSMGLVP